MVFEAIVVDILNKFLNKYIENLDSSQLKIGIWGGDVVLADLIIKQNIFKDLDLPVKVVYGKLGKLILKIPWKNLYGDSTSAIIENLFLIVIPASEMKYDALKEEKYIQDKKQLKLKLVEEAKKRELEGGKVKSNDTFVEKLAMYIMKTIQIEIKNIHVRYEDKTSDSEVTFNMGLTMSRLSLESIVNDPFPEEFQQDGKDLIFKIIELEGFAIYWNVGTELISELQPQNIIEILLKNIPKNNSKPNSCKYIFGPLTAKALFRLNPKPEKDETNYSIPKVFILIELEEIKLALSRKQYGSIFAFLENLHLMSTAARFRKYKPFGIPVIGHAKEWWHFAYSAVTEDVKRRKLEWSWNHIKKHREMCRNYSKLYHMKLTNKKISQNVLKDLEELEKNLSVFDLILLREQVYVEAERISESETETKTNPGGWFSYFFSYGSNPSYGVSGAYVAHDADNDENIVSRIGKVMTPKEKEKLYKGIDYEENLTKTIYPDEFIEFKFVFRLKALRIRVYDDEKVSERCPAVLSVNLWDLITLLEKRPPPGAVKCEVSLGDFNALGFAAPHEETPVLVKSSRKKFENLVNVLFEANPLDKSCDQRIHVNANGLLIIYHAYTTNTIHDIFKSKSEEKVNTIVAATAASLPNFHEITSMGLQYAISKSSRLEVKAQILASTLIVPYGGVYEESKEFVLVKLGQLEILTEELSERDITVKKLHLQGSSEKDIFSKFLSASYRKFNCQLKGVQILHRLNDEEWTKVLESEHPSPLRLLEPTNLTIVFKKCLVTDDARIPKAVIEGKLPSIIVNISEDRVISLAALAYSIPTSTSHGEAFVTKRLSTSAWSLQSHGTQLDTKMRSKTERPQLSVNENYTQGIDLVARFEMNKFTVNVMKGKIVSEENHHSQEKFLYLCLLRLESALTCKTFEILAEIKLGSVEISHNHENLMIPLVQAKVPQDDYYLVLVEYQNVNKRAPDFFTRRGGIITKLKCNLTDLDVLFHKEAMIESIAFLKLLQTRLDQVKGEEPSKLCDDESKRLYSIIEEGLEVAISEKRMIPKGKKFRKRREMEVVDLMIEIIMDSFTVKLISDLIEITELSVKGGKIELSTRESCMNIDCKLNDVLVLDLNPVTRHKMIVSSVDEKTLSMKVTIFNKEFLETIESVDLSIDAEIGRIRCILLNRFFCSTLEFMNSFQSEISVLAQGASVAAQKAKEEVIRAYENQTKISLDIKITAPLIVVPRKSSSMEVILIDMGILTVKSFITELEDANISNGMEKNVPLMDVIACHLENLKLSRATLNPVDKKQISETSILDPVTLEITLQRNLSISWYSDMIPLQVQGRLELIHVTLTHTGLNFILNAMQENLMEGQTQESNIKNTEVIMLEDDNEEFMLNRGFQKYSKEEDIKNLDEKIRPSLRFSFQTDRFIFDTVNDTIKVLQTEDAKSENLAKFVLDVISVKSTIFSDGSISTCAFLSNITVDDTRPGKEGRITKLMERRVESAKENLNTTLPSMFNINFEKKGPDLFTDLRVSGFDLILSMDFLSNLLIFFKIDDSVSSQHPSQTQIKQMEIKQRRSSIKSTKDLSQGKKIVNKKNEFESCRLPTFTINIRLDKPNIVIVENIDTHDTEAIVFNTELVMKYRRAGTRQVINGTLIDIGLMSCRFTPHKRPQPLFQIVKPFTISMAGSTPENQGLHIDICLTDIYLTINTKTVELLNKCFQAVMTDLSQNELVSPEKDYSDIWKIKTFKAEDFWFMKTEQGVDALLTLNKAPTISSFGEILEEICLVSIPSLVITLEDVTSKTRMPLILFEMSLQSQIHNWSTQLTIDNLMKIQMHYFNRSVSSWEPFIEPLEMYRDRKSFFVPWELECNITVGNEGAVDSGADVESNLRPIVSVTFSCMEKLEITVTKTCIDVFQNLAEAFTTAVSQTAQMKMVSYPPFVVKNDTGFSIELLLEKSNMHVFRKKKEGYKIVELQTGAKVELEQGKNKLQKSTASSKKVFVIEKKELYLHIKCSLFKDEVLVLPISISSKRYFPILNNNSREENQGLISDVNVIHYSNYITLRSILQIKNNFLEAIDVLQLVSSRNEVEYVGTVEGNSFLNLPLQNVYSSTKELFFTVKGYSMSNLPFVWENIQQDECKSELLQCNSKNPEDNDPFFIMVIGEIEQVYYENTLRHTMAGMCINIRLQPTLELLNSLPVDLIVQGEGSVHEKLLSSGEKLQMPHAEPGISTITLRISNYLEREWSCKTVIPNRPPEFLVWTFESYDGLASEEMNIGVFYSTSHSSVTLNIYSPYLMVNNTGLMLSYRFDDHNSVVYHPPNHKQPLIFSPSLKKFFSKKKVFMKVNQGEWSDKFPINVVGSGGIIECFDPIADCNFLIAVTTTLTFNSLTKIVKLAPCYVLLNKTNECIQCQECGSPENPWITIKPQDCAPFWPASEDKKRTIHLKLQNKKEITPPFCYDSTDTVLLKLNNKFGGFFVDIQTTNAGTNIIIDSYETGLAPALILNDTKETLYFWEKGAQNVTFLNPHEMLMYAWEAPADERKLLFHTDKRKEVGLNLKEDVFGEFHLGADVIKYMSFLDGNQRILLFTQDQSVESDLRLAERYENSDKEIVFKIHGIGISLVNNITQTEILYMTFLSSGISWESKKESQYRFKPMNSKRSHLIENAYQKYLECNDTESSTESITVIDNKIQVNFQTLDMLYPTKKKLRRVFEPGLWTSYRTSANFMTLHMKVNKIQIDNQLHDCIFPTILCPILPPKTVAVSHGPKPFFEASLLKVSVGNSKAQQYKYFKVLIQEFGVKLDIGFISQLWSFLSSDNATDEVYKQKFKRDISFCEKPLLSHVTVSSTTEQKHFYDLLHFSPLKVHLTFSMAGNVETSLLPPALGVLIQSLGVTLTDFSDVLFRLSYFERKSVFLSQGQLQNEVTRHYYGQAVRQAYVLVLGLDVIGNPFGLVIGIGRGVEAFFYEPVQGIIQGPSDFAAGLALGCKSLFGHTVGGTAGTLGRLTGTLGKGLAVLSLDKEYQRQRMEQQNRRQTAISASMAQSGRGVVMGVFEGVTGVVMKPISGAKQEGVGGFFKGMGKGMMGLVTRPVSGVIDFASTSFNAVKRVTEAGNECSRVRPPRFFEDDKLVTPYKKHDARGNYILCEVDKRRFFKTDKYEYHAELRGGEVIILTNKRLLITAYSDTFGNWQLHFELPWLEMSTAPEVHVRGLTISLSRKKSGVFHSSKDVKVLIIDDPYEKEILTKKMIELYYLETKTGT